MKNKIYYVIKGDIKKGYGEPILLKEGKIGYCVHNHKTKRFMKENVFEEIEEAKRVAQDYLEKNDVILAKDIKPIVIESYSFFNAKNKRAFLCEIGNGFLYVKCFFTCAYIVKDTEEEREKFHQHIINSEKYGLKKEMNVPKIKNMYKCDTEYNWLYAEAGYEPSV